MLSNLPINAITIKSNWACGVIYACSTPETKSEYFADDGFGNYIPIEILQSAISFDFDPSELNFH